MSDVKIFAPALNGTAFVGMMEVEPNGPDAGYVQRTDYNALAAECDALKAILPCGHPKSMDDSYGGCVWCTTMHTLTTLEDEYDALKARLAEAEKDAAIDREIAQRNRDAVHELTERLAEAERERDEFYARAVSLFHLIPGEVAVKDLTDVLDEYKRWRASVSASGVPE